MTLGRMMYERRRNIVLRPDGRRVNVARFRGQLFVCALGCCCGRTEDGFAPVPAARWHEQWEQRRLRNIVHLTVGGCLGPCGLANVVQLVFDGQAIWFHSINSERLVDLIYDYVDLLLSQDHVVPPHLPLAVHQFTATSWQPRPDGQPVDDFRPRRSVVASNGDHACAGSNPSKVLDGSYEAGRPSAAGAAGPAGVPTTAVAQTSVQRAVAMMDGRAALPRKNGELVFEEPWHGRAFGMAVALHEAGLYEWEEFRQALIHQIRVAESTGGKFVYYEAWLAALESVLAASGDVPTGDLDEVTYQFEYGERDDVY
jgi:cobaltochelatase CobN